ncbi:MAG: beta-ketoacyl synthase N-terminal-like domain-containing protein [Oligoflexales bacterium]
MKRIYIHGVGAVSGRGYGLEQHRQPWSQCRMSRYDGIGWGVSVHENVEAQLKNFSSTLKKFDRATQLGVLAAELALMNSSFSYDKSKMGVVVGSSRGSTQTLEEQYRLFLEGSAISSFCSPLTTAGVFSAAIAREFGLFGMQVSVSNACATGLQAFGLALSLVSSGVVPACLTGGAEAPLTSFTFEQFKRLRLLSQHSAPWPLRPRESTGMALGEGAGCLVISSEKSDVLVRGFGSSSEEGSLTGVSNTALSLQAAIVQCLGCSGLKISDIDLIVGHGVGTKVGDLAEKAGLEALGAKNIPWVSHKWALGHTLGAAGSLSIAFAVDMLRGAKIKNCSWYQSKELDVDLHNILVVAMGFGGIASAVLISKNLER